MNPATHRARHAVKTVAQQAGAAAALRTIKEVTQSLRFTRVDQLPNRVVVVVDLKNGDVLTGHGPSQVDATVEAFESIWPLPDHALREQLSPHGEGCDCGLFQ